jgi:hypothetical protein
MPDRRTKLFASMRKPEVAAHALDGSGGGGVQLDASTRKRPRTAGSAAGRSDTPRASSAGSDSGGAPMEVCTEGSSAGAAFDSSSTAAARRRPTKASGARPGPGAGAGAGAGAADCGDELDHSSSSTFSALAAQKRAKVSPSWASTGAASSEHSVSANWAAAVSASRGAPAPLVVMSAALPPSLGFQASASRLTAAHLADVLTRDAILTPEMSEALSRFAGPSLPRHAVQRGVRPDGGSDSSATRPPQPSSSFSSSSSLSASTNNWSFLLGFSGDSAGAAASSSSSSSAAAAAVASSAVASSSSHAPSSASVFSLAPSVSDARTAFAESLPASAHRGSMPMSSSFPDSVLRHGVDDVRTPALRVLYSAEGVPCAAHANAPWCDLFGFPLPALESMASCASLPRFVANVDADRYAALCQQTAASRLPSQSIVVHFVAADGTAFRARETRHLEYRPDGMRALYRATVHYSDVVPLSRSEAASESAPGGSRGVSSSESRLNGTVARSSVGGITLPTPLLAKLSPIADAGAVTSSSSSSSSAHAAEARPPGLAPQVDRERPARGPPQASSRVLQTAPASAAGASSPAPPPPWGILPHRAGAPPASGGSLLKDPAASANGSRPSSSSSSSSSSSALGPHLTFASSVPIDVQAALAAQQRISHFTGDVLGPPFAYGFANGLYGSAVSAASSDATRGRGSSSSRQSDASAHTSRDVADGRGAGQGMGGKRGFGAGAGSDGGSDPSGSGFTDPFFDVAMGAGGGGSGAGTSSLSSAFFGLGTSDTLPGLSADELGLEAFIRA